jgi:hypothetical protein
MTAPSLKFQYVTSLDAPRMSARFRAALRKTIGTKQYRRRNPASTRKPVITPISAG